MLYKTGWFIDDPARAPTPIQITYKNDDIALPAAHAIALPTPRYTFLDTCEKRHNLSSVFFHTHPPTLTHFHLILTLQLVSLYCIHIMSAVWSSSLARFLFLFLSLSFSDKQHFVQICSLKWFQSTLITHKLFSTILGLFELSWESWKPRPNVYAQNIDFFVETKMVVRGLNNEDRDAMFSFPGLDHLVSITTPARSPLTLHLFSYSFFSI